MDNACVLSGTPQLAAGCVALTYDDGPGPRTAELAELLRAEQVPATFFVLGESIERYGQVLDTVRDCGHPIGLHAERHHPFDSAAQAADQLARCRARIPDYLSGPAWYRPPYGIGDHPLPGYAGPIGWHAHGRDWDITYRQGQTVAGCVEQIMATLVELAGGVVLLHDFAPRTEFLPRQLTEARLDLRVLEVTALLLERLREQGYQLVGLPAPATAVITESAEKIG